MKRNFHLSPPESVSFEAFDRGRDVYGNATSHYLIFWSNGLTGEACASGNYKTARRVQTGYGDGATDGAIGIAMDLFPGTQWDGAEMTETRHGATGTLVRDYARERVPVIFRAERSGDFAGEVTAVFPTLPGTDDSDVTIYAHNGQHGTGARGWYQGTRAATDAEAASLKKELESAPFNYRLDVVKRWTRHHDEKRAAEYHASRERALAANIKAEAV